MRIQVTGRNVTVSNELSTYAIEKIGKLERYFDGIQDAQVIFSEQRNVRVCEVTLKASGKIIRAEFKGSEFMEAVDFVAEKLERQIRRYKEKFRDKKKEAAAREPEPVFVKPEEFEPAKIVRVKEIPIKQMNYEEAVMQMELLSHDFFVFFNQDRRVNILYRRKDGNYGVLEPIEA